MSTGNGSEKSRRPALPPANFEPLKMKTGELYTGPGAQQHARAARLSLEQKVIRGNTAAAILVMLAPTPAGVGRDKLYERFHRTMTDPSNTFYSNTDQRGMVHRFTPSSSTPQVVHLSYADTCTQLQRLGKEGFRDLVTRQGTYCDSEVSRNRPNPYDVVVVLFPTSTYAGNGTIQVNSLVEAHVTEVRGWASALEVRLLSVLVNDSGASPDQLDRLAGYVASFSAQEILCVSFDEPTPATVCMVDTVHVHLLERALDRVERVEAREDVMVAPEIQLRRVFAMQHISQRAGLDASDTLQLLGESRFLESVDSQRLLEQLASRPGADGDALNAVRQELAECEHILQDLQVN